VALKSGSRAVWRAIQSRQTHASGLCGSLYRLIKSRQSRRSRRQAQVEVEVEVEARVLKLERLEPRGCPGPSCLRAWDSE
jgi:hypothetical protein